MKGTILGVAALLAGGVVLAGCGGGGQAAGTTGGVAGAHHSTASANFRAGVHGLEARVQTSVNAFESGNVSKAATSGAGLLANCTSTVDNQLAPHATTLQQQQAVVHLRLACSDMAKAAHSGMSGNLASAKSFARAALKQTQIAARLSG